GERIFPYTLGTESETWLEVAEALLEIFRGKESRTRGEIEEEIEETFGSDPGQLVQQGLIKLLEDRCEFDVASDHPPEQLRQAAFRAAALHRAVLGPTLAVPAAPPPQPSPPAGGRQGGGPPPTFDRANVLKQAA